MKPHVQYEDLFLLSCLLFFLKTFDYVATTGFHCAGTGWNSLTSVKLQNSNMDWEMSQEPQK